MFKPILTATDLPPIGATREHYSLDMKAVMDTSKRFEMAKDMAAFANSMGGTLLIGAVEDQATGTLAAYRPLSEFDAATTIKAYSETVINRCFPAPFIDSKSIPLNNGHIIAINIWAFPGQPVGVKTRADKIDGFGGDSYVFPVRSGVDTNFIRPDQLPMFMLPEVRRRAIMLESIPAMERSALKIVCGTVIRRVKLATVNHLANTFTVEWEKGNSPALTFTLPIDTIKYIWKNTDGTWKITTTKFIINDDGSTDIFD
ncbi:ATP-binding protein [Myxococcus llanfairpwllgwyngyllgogerychwyrndrobwllllantysiliogogogochensis]|uniref:ATP-binding protein n=1 Tax=Myxococcus llanfairpwllgwyngyllgogerychwyrndrobwllllantysiliogogogochensis TaxID=2590453 RepID=A0A540X4E3_9BACT|nr:ATP-binding protein [Myxococcus llanfairpwllgwyngyllgogerychwyrndrobwllllantysiliogogogochensis]TQF16117.1 ATP-binding protein [Myxococcus llanfairpwllgwyngyllgogerychwyrndrobwllllantysiliogogogochensis]